jgi:hypothetical protein
VSEVARGETDKYGYVSESAHAHVWPCCQFPSDEMTTAKLQLCAWRWEAGCSWWLRQQGSWRCVELEVVMVVVIEAVLAAAMVDGGGWWCGGGGVCVRGADVVTVHQAFVTSRACLTLKSPVSK